MTGVSRHWPQGDRVWVTQRRISKLWVATSVEPTERSGDWVEVVPVDSQPPKETVSATDVVAWLRSSEWDGDATWEYYARAIADDIERSLKGAVLSTINKGLHEEGCHD